MKKRISILILSAVVLAMSSCSKDYWEIPNYGDANEEKIVLGTETHNGITTDNVYSGQSVDEGRDFSGTLFTMRNGVVSYLSKYFEDDGYGSSYWMGFAISSNFESSPVAGSGGGANYEYEFSAYAKSDKSGDGRFVNACYAEGYEVVGENGDEYDVPAYYPMIKFSNDKDLDVIYIANNAMTVSYGAPESYVVTVIGTDENGINEGIDVNMLDSNGDFRYGWIKVFLSSLDDIVMLKFEVTSSDPLIPTYFCIDALSY